MHKALFLLVIKILIITIARNRDSRKKKRTKPADDLLWIRLKSYTLRACNVINYSYYNPNIRTEGIFQSLHSYIDTVRFFTRIKQFLFRPKPIICQEFPSKCHDAHQRERQGNQSLPSKPFHYPRVHLGDIGRIAYQDARARDNWIR